MPERRSAVGFIGLGAMGQPMAARIGQAGYPLVVFDADPQRTRECAQALSAEAAANPREVAARAATIVTMLPTSTIVEQVLRGEQGVLAALRPGASVIEMSSGEPTHTRRLADLVRAGGGELADAPVSGGVPRARTGELSIMFGGDPALLDRVRPILACLGTTVTRTGDVGSAHAMKALNNLVSAGGFLIGVEALLIGKRFGLDPALMVDVLNASTGMNNSTQKKFKQFVLSRSFDSGFGLDLMVKDISIGLGLAEETNTEVPFARLCRELWTQARAELGAGHDHTEMARFAEKVARMPPG